MVEGGENTEIVSEDIAEILQKVAELMEGFYKSDLALQNALSSLTQLSAGAPNLFELQHVDLITQSHADLSKLLAALAKAVSGTPVFRKDLQKTLTLRSLQDSLIDSKTVNTDDVAAGELSLF